MTHDGRREAIVAIDTATSRVVVATGTRDGALDGVSTWTAGHRHGETLLPGLSRFLGEQNIRRSRLRGIVVGTGPGAFTGLRVGIATAKGVAHGFGIPIAGVSTAEALIASAAAAEDVSTDRIVLLVPAGPSDRIVVRAGAAPALLVSGAEPALDEGDRLVAVDLDGRAPSGAVRRGGAASEGLGAALIALGTALLRSGGDDLAELVPEYVTLPRGVTAPSGEVTWSRDPR